MLWTLYLLIFFSWLCNTSPSCWREILTKFHQRQIQVCWGNVVINFPPICRKIIYRELHLKNVGNFKTKIFCNSKFLNVNVWECQNWKESIISVNGDSQPTNLTKSTWSSNNPVSGEMNWNRCLSLLSRSVFPSKKFIKSWITSEEQHVLNANLYWTYGRVDKNKNKGNARKMQICIGLMESWIKTNARKMQGKCKFVLDRWKGG